MIFAAVWPQAGRLRQVVTSSAVYRASWRHGSARSQASRSDESGDRGYAVQGKHKGEQVFSRPPWKRAAPRTGTCSNQTYRP